MKLYGLIGYPLSHSFSKKFFTEKFHKEHITDSTYDIFPMEDIHSLPNLLKENPNLHGLNVTVPHKINVLKFLDWIEHDAKQVGAVNCIRIFAESPVMAAFTGEVGVIGHNFRLEGYNTDVYGFETSLKPLLQNWHGEALILGDGGAAKAVKYVIEKLGMDYQIVTRKPQLNSILFTDLTPRIIENYKLIINTTPVGMYPNVEDCPLLPYEAITDEHLLYDLIYNPEETLFLKNGAKHGATIKNGLEMLILQAEKSWEIWNSK
jgi:shikimate dehydrogenase